MVKCGFKHTFYYFSWIKSTLKPTFYYEKGGDWLFTHFCSNKKPEAKQNRTSFGSKSRVRDLIVRLYSGQLNKETQ